jgi:hypothetical protein
MSLVATPSDAKEGLAGAVDSSGREETPKELVLVVGDWSEEREWRRDWRRRRRKSLKKTL